MIRLVDHTALPEDFDTQARRMLDELVRGGAALGWIEPPGPDEVEALFGAVVAQARHGDAVLHAAVDGDRVVGLGYWRRYERPTLRRHADLQRLAVEPAAQGRGVGRLLTESLVDSARRSGIEVLTLDARGDNERALALYRSVGFTEYGRLREFVVVGAARYDLVFYSLTLRA